MKLTDREIEWLEYAVEHMLDDSEPEDQTCAEVLKELLLRHNQCLRSEAADDFLGKYNADEIPTGKVLDDIIDKAMSNKE